MTIYSVFEFIAYKFMTMKFLFDSLKAIFILKKFYVKYFNLVLTKNIFLKKFKFKSWFFRKQKAKSTKTRKNTNHTNFEFR